MSTEMTIDDLVSPLAAETTPRSAAPRWSGESGTIMLSDSMLNGSAGWGRGILSSVEKVIGEFSPQASIETINRPQIGDHRPHEFVEHLCETMVSGLVVTAGDCATCTSRALRECVLAEESGIAATGVIPSALNEIARATLISWGRPDLQIAWLETPLFQLRPETLGVSVRQASVQAWHILTGR
jgi:hypothetical protein